jgi:hypothetical protein
LGFMQVTDEEKLALMLINSPPIINKLTHPRVRPPAAGALGGALEPPYPPPATAGETSSGKPPLDTSE